MAGEGLSAGPQRAVVHARGQPLGEAEQAAIACWLEAEDTLTVVPGFIGACPNALYAVARAELPRIGEAVAGLSSEAGYRAFADRYAVRRTRPDFWTHSDALIEAYARSAPVEAGVFDYNRLDNR